MAARPPPPPPAPAPPAVIPPASLHGPLIEPSEVAVDQRTMEATNQPMDVQGSELAKITQTFTGSFLLHLEKSMMINAEKARLEKELRAALDSGAVVPGFRSKNGLQGKQVVNARLRSLQLVDLQRQVRADVEAQQEAIRALPPKDYRAFQRNCYNLISTTVQKRYEANRAAVRPIDVSRGENEKQTEWTMMTVTAHNKMLIGLRCLVCAVLVC